MNWLYLASVLSGVTTLLHVFGGGLTTARPLLKSELEDRAKYTNYYCWHMVSIVLLALTVCFFLAGQDIEFRELGVLSFALSLAFAIWSTFLIYIKKQKPFILPQWLFFYPIAAVSAVGLFS